MTWDTFDRKAFLERRHAFDALLTELYADVIRRREHMLLDLPFHPEVIHGHHHIGTMTALALLLGVPAIYSCHGSKPWQEVPPTFPRILRYVAVDEGCRQRIVREAKIPFEEVRLLLNFVDTDIFRQREPLPPRPVRGLVFNNNSSEANYASAVRAACQQCDIALEIRGLANGNSTNEPQNLLPHYDIVFAKVWAAIEAMAVGCAVVLYDTAALAGADLDLRIHLRKMKFRSKMTSSIKL
jgi:hypothetical protein